MRMVILGAGVAGGMAAGYFSSLSPTLVEGRKESEEHHHKAILRFRDPSVGYLLGVPLEKIRVEKSIWSQDRFVTPNPMVNNAYSQKVAKGIFPRSVGDVGVVERYVPKLPLCFPQAKFGYVLESLEPGRCYFQNGERLDYDVCISTIPLPVLAVAAGIDWDVESESYPICVIHCDVIPKCTVCQTVYFPDLGMPIYRASLEFGKLIIECEHIPSVSDLEEAISVFGLGRSQIGNCKDFQQQNGKLVDMPEGKRKLIITRFTEKYNVFSLGRYATWRNITADRFLQDLEKIAQMMRLDEANRKYALSLERI